MNSRFEHPMTTPAPNPTPDGERRDVLEGLSGYTPGPWTAATADLHGEDDTRWSVLTAGERQYFIASIENGAPGDTLETEFANALLIARAPELVDEVRELRAALRDLKGVVKEDLLPIASKHGGSLWAADAFRINAVFDRVDALLPATGDET